MCTDQFIDFITACLSKFETNQYSNTFIHDVLGCRWKLCYHFSLESSGAVVYAPSPSSSFLSYSWLLLYNQLHAQSGFDVVLFCIRNNRQTTPLSITPNTILFVCMILDSCPLSFLIICPHSHPSEYVDSIPIVALNYVSSPFSFWYEP